MDKIKSFSQRTKEYLLTVEADEKCCCFAELAGIALFAGRTRNGELHILSELEGTIKKAVKLSKLCFGKSFEMHKGKGSFYCVITDIKIFDSFYEKSSYVDFWQGISEKECCRVAFLRGAFLGGGTVVDPNKNYNMEFSISDSEVCEEFVKMLDAMGLGFKKTLRNGNLVLYTKNSETIGDALAYMGAFSAQMELLNIKIEKEIRNDMNRAANGETANMDKILTASAQQITAIQKIESCIGLDNIPDELREVAFLRNKYKDISLERLGKMLTPPLSKSGVNHRIKKIMSIAENI